VPVIARNNLVLQVFVVRALSSDRNVFPRTGSALDAVWVTATVRKVLLATMGVALISPSIGGSALLAAMTVTAPLDSVYKVLVVAGFALRFAATLKNARAAEFVAP
jgi:hypothetical protein